MHSVATNIEELEKMDDLVVLRCCLDLLKIFSPMGNLLGN